MSWLQPRRPHSHRKVIAGSAPSERTASLISRYVASFSAMRFLCPSPMPDSLLVLERSLTRRDQEPHVHGRAAGSLVDLERVAQIRDERQAEAEAGRVGAR